MVRILTQEIKSDLKLIFKGVFILTILVFLVSLFWGFDLSFLLGLVIGSIYICWNLFYLALTISKSVQKDISKAKKSMYGSYFLRYSILVILACVAFFVEFISIFGFFIPLLFPKIVIGFNILFLKERKV